MLLRAASAGDVGPAHGKDILAQVDEAAAGTLMWNGRTASFSAAAHGFSASTLTMKLHCAPAGDAAEMIIPWFNLN
jgi:hypothetical protein